MWKQWRTDGDSRAENEHGVEEVEEEEHLENCALGIRKRIVLRLLLVALLRAKLFCAFAPATGHHSAQQTLVLFMNSLRTYYKLHMNYLQSTYLFLMNSARCERTTAVDKSQAK